jgi:hypothetical protein
MDKVELLGTPVNREPGVDHSVRSERPIYMPTCEPRAVSTKTPAEAEHTVLELAALLDAYVRMTQIILQALEARIVGLKKVVRLRRLLVAGWVRRCARLYGVHSGHPFSVGRVPRSGNSCGAISFPTSVVYHF